MLYARIKKDFGDFTLDLEFENKKETLALFGASGCGKSMTLRCIAGIVQPDEGRIVLNNRVLFDSEKNINLLSQERKVGLLFQNYALFPNMTLAENLAIGLPREKRKDFHLVEEKIDAFSLRGLENNYPHQLSGGQEQRAALARMLLNEPEILMLDEPFSALDEHLRWQMEQELIFLLKENKISTLYVSHNKDEVFRICDRIAVMDRGSIEEIGTRERIFSNPKTYNSALLTGCQNISKIKKVSPKKLYALDWGLEIDTDEYIGDHIKYLGIHNHSIHLADRDKDENKFPFRIIDVLKNYSTSTLILSPSKKESLDSKSYIYLEVPKDGTRDFEEGEKIELSFKKENLLLLK